MKKLIILLFFTALFYQSDAQTIGLKNNLLYSASASPNLGVEIGLAPQLTLDISAGFNPFKFSHNRQWRHWLVQPEVRWWSCERFNGHFLAAHIIGGGFNVGNLSFFPFSMWDSLENTRYKGHAFGVGIGYGYAWMLGKRWNLEAEIGVGYAHAWYDSYHYAADGEYYGSGDKNYWGLTKMAISFVYLF